jgi:hypothetical protein
MEKLAQSVGNANMSAEVDCATALCARESRALPPPASQTREHSMALLDTNDVIRRFNRDTKWLATLVVGAVISAALMLAVLIQDRHARAVALTEEAVQGGGALLPNANFATPFKDAGLKVKKATGEITSGQASSVDHAFTEISPKQNPSSQMEAAASSPTAVLAVTPEINHANAQANASSWSLAQWQDSAPVIRPKIRNGRYSSSVRHRLLT